MAGFTLVELLVVIAILGLTLALIGVAAKPVSPATHARGAAQEISGGGEIAPRPPLTLES